MDNYQKSIYVKAKRRGMVELDFVIGFVADNYLTKMQPHELKLFDEFLDLSDELLYKCLMGSEVIPIKYKPIWDLVKGYKKR
jgi:succinate dehydrogenase flavin-adding protein (antitoxin of CptAB toxin-antitoxin module)